MDFLEYDDAIVILITPEMASPSCQVEGFIPKYSVFSAEVELVEGASQINQPASTSFKFLSGPGPGRALVLLLIKATDAISLERVAQAALPLGNQFAMADAHGGKLACCPTAVLQKVSTIPLLTLLSSCFELEAVACSSFCRWTSEYLNHLINQIAAQKDALYI
ncbi:uncharacterized protein LOC100535597 [Danio rerio]|uniref:Si:ch211-198m1.1 n=1 Tax=Danio rerio TaxID=7955 RepID=E9QBA2_DANRE|nr:uncharacterized protein LOC100535597 [Danio rerio]|eukprot:NP_001315023.1 uncharacterized protein LOC100535597 [Danio rerio]